MFIMLSAVLNARVCLAVSVFIVHKLEIIVLNVIQTILFLCVIIVKLWCEFPCSSDMLLKLYSYSYHYSELDFTVTERLLICKHWYF